MKNKFTAKILLMAMLLAFTGAKAQFSLVKDIKTTPSTASSYPDSFCKIGIITFFAATDYWGKELWKTDGTPEGTQMVKDINPGSSGSTPSNLIEMGGVLYFKAKDGINGTKLWKSDGTEEGTIITASVDNGYFNSVLAASNNQIFCQATTDLGNELWKYTPPVSITWNGTIWTSTPSAELNAIIDGSNYTGGSFACTDLTINSGEVLTIAAGVEVTVNGTLNNQTGTAGLIIEDGGSLKHSTPNVLATVKKSMEGGMFTKVIDRNWNMMSSPIESFPVQNLFTNDIVYQYNNAGLNEETAWEALVSGNPFEAMKGYLVYTENSRTVNFAGEMNQGSLTFTLSNAGNGYNMVGNPYPSLIDWNQVQSANASDINNYFAYWNNSEPAYYYYSEGVSNPVSVTTLIPVGQAFFVQEASHAIGAKYVEEPPYDGEVNIDNNVRVHLSDMQPVKTTTIADIIRFKLSNTHYNNETVLYFSENGSDVESMGTLVAEAPVIYTLSGEKQLVINQEASVEGTQSFNVGMYIPKVDNYSFTAFDFENMDKSVTLTLEDTKTGEMVDLKKNPIHNFSVTEAELANGNEINDRFIFHLNATPTAIETTENTIANIYSHASTIYINLAYAEESTITVFDLSGRKVKELNSSAKAIQINSLQEGTYIIKVTSDKGNKVQKVFVK